MAEKIIANDIKCGNIIEYKNKLWVVLKTFHTKPGKGGAFVQMELKDITKDTKLNERFRSEETIQRAFLEEESCQFLFAEEDTLTFMHTETFEQLQVNKEIFGEKLAYLKEGINVRLVKYDNNIISAILPDKISFKIEETEPYIKGQTASASYKPATLENGIKITVPPFIKAGDEVWVNTETDSYDTRVKEEK